MLEISWRTYLHAALYAYVASVQDRKIRYVEKAKKDEKGMCPTHDENICDMLLRMLFCNLAFAGHSHCQYAAVRTLILLVHVCT